MSDRVFWDVLTTLCTWSDVGADSQALEPVEPDEEEDMTVPNALLALTLELVKPRGEPLSISAVSCEQMNACCLLSQTHLRFTHAVPKRTDQAL